jgi:hypothetical protein
MTNRPMTIAELSGYTGAFYGFVLDSEEYQSRLYVAPVLTADDAEGNRVGPDPEEWTPVRDRYILYGDLRAAFDVGDDYEPEGDYGFGNHAVARMIQERIAPGSPLAEGIDFDPEGATFFAYVGSADKAVALAAFISEVVEERRVQHA